MGRGHLRVASGQGRHELLSETGTSHAENWRNSIPDRAARAKAGSEEGFCMWRNRRIAQECHESVDKCSRWKVEV